MHKWRNRIAALAVALATVCAGNTNALAASSLPDDSTPRSLTIIKYDSVDAAAASGTGHYDEVNTSEHTPMANITFDVYRYAELGSNVPSSITVEDAETWAAANTNALAQSLVTDSSGKATWVASQEGTSADAVYLVIERKHGAITETGRVNPFFVSLPYTETDGASWIYDVTVQPKNTIVSGPTITMDVSDFDIKSYGVDIGQQHPWLIRTTIPEDLYYTETVNDETKEMYGENYSISTTLKDTLTYKGNVKVIVASNEKEVLTLGADDYVVSGTVKEGTAGGVLTVTLTQAGMKKVAEGSKDLENKELVTYFDSYLNSDAICGTPVYENATLDYTSSTGFVYSTVEVPEAERPEVHTGGFKLLKVDSADTTKKLSGAQFHVASSESNAKNSVWLKDSSGTDILLTTDDSGAASYKGLAYNAQASDPQGGTYYWLVETAVPTGYEANTTPIRITVNADTYLDNTVPYEIQNTLAAVKKTALPLTGNDNQNMLWVVALALIAGAGILGIAGLLTKRRSKS
jgi:fimbrial isopeptide formation D2 family protein